MPIVSPILCGSPLLVVYRLNKSATTPPVPTVPVIQQTGLSQVSAPVFAPMGSTNGTFSISQLRSARSAQRSAAHHQVKSVELATTIEVTSDNEELAGNKKRHSWELGTIDEKDFVNNVPVLESGSSSQVDDAQSQNSSDLKDDLGRRTPPRITVDSAPSIDDGSPVVFAEVESEEPKPRTVSFMTSRQNK